MSKGHACWPYYVLLRERGLSPKLEGHPKRDPHNGVWCTTGSLGHGLPSAAGMALAKRLKGVGGRVFVLMGDAECQTGTTWESMLIASRLKLGNLVAIVDWNGIQGSDFVKDVLPITGHTMYKTAWELGWCSREVNGHDVEELQDALIFVGGPGAEIAIERADTGERPAPGPGGAQPAVATREAASAERGSVRVGAARLDTLMNLVGELVTVQARLSRHAGLGADPGLAGIAEEVERLTGDLRDVALGIRCDVAGVR